MNPKDWHLNPFVLLMKMNSHYVFVEKLFQLTEHETFLRTHRVAKIGMEELWHWCRCSFLLKEIHPWRLLSTLSSHGTSMWWHLQFNCTMDTWKKHIPRLATNLFCFIPRLEKTRRYNFIFFIGIHGSNLFFGVVPMQENAACFVLSNRTNKNFWP